MTANAAITNVYLDSEVEKDLADRLARVEGHVRGIKRMLEAHESCESLLLQLSAVRSALNQVAARLLENHMETCVADCVRSGAGEQALAHLKRALTQVLKDL